MQSHSSALLFLLLLLTLPVLLMCQWLTLYQSPLNTDISHKKILSLVDRETSKHSSLLMSDNWLNNSQPSGKHTLRFSLIIFLYAASLPFLKNHYMYKFLNSYRVQSPSSLAAFQHQPPGPRERSTSRSFVHSVQPQGTRLHLTLSLYVGHERKSDCSWLPSLSENSVQQQSYDVHGKNNF